MSGPVAFGPVVTQGGVAAASNLAVKVYRRTAPTTLVVELDESFGRNWQDQFNETGSGSLQVLNDDPDLASVVMGDLIRFELKGVVAFALLARDWQRASLAQGEEAEQITTIAGPGHLAVLDEAVLYPSRPLGARPIQEDRPFNWAAVEFDDSSWPTAQVLQSVGDANAGGWPNQPFATDFPDGTSSVIAPWSGTIYSAPVGFCYYRHTFTVTTAAWHVISGTADNNGKLYIDGQLIYEIGGFASTYQQRVKLSAGDHTIAVQVENTKQPAFEHLPGTAPENLYLNPSGFAVAVYTIDNSGNNIVRVTKTDSSWLIAEYPGAPPGMTPGEIIRLIVTEAQARGAIPEITLNFDDNVDSNGDAWPKVDYVTKVGTDVLSVIRELAGSYIDVAISPAGFDLYAWNKDGRGNQRYITTGPATTYAATTNPATSNLAGLTHHKVM